MSKYSNNPPNGSDTTTKSTISNSDTNNHSGNNTIIQPSPNHRNNTTSSALIHSTTTTTNPNQQIYTHQENINNEQQQNYIQEPPSITLRNSTTTPTSINDSNNEINNINNIEPIPLNVNNTTANQSESYIMNRDKRDTAPIIRNSNVNTTRNLLTPNPNAPTYLQLPLVFPSIEHQHDQTTFPTPLNSEHIPYNRPQTDFQMELDNLENKTLLEQNMKDNIAYGDSIHTKQPNTIRLYFQNIRGAKNNNKWDDWTKSAQYLNKNEIDIISYTETNIKWTDALKVEARNHLKLKTKSYYNHSIISTSNSNDPYGSYFQPGGTCTIVTNNLTGRVIKDISDPSGLGRWSGFKIKRDKTHHLNIITAYCANTDSK